VGCGGGGTPWDTIVYDPELDLVFVGTGNARLGTAICAARRWRQSLSRFHHLLSGGTDGELVWPTKSPRGNWDYDATQPLMLANLKIGP